MAAAAALAVSVAGLTAAPAARADELADMRADMQLLQKRMDQLAQFAPGSTGGTAMGTKPAPGAGLVGGSFPRSFLIPGTDTSIRIGGAVQEVADYWMQGGPPNGNQTTDLGANNQALFAPLNFKSTSFVPGFPTRRQLVAQPNSLGGVGGLGAIIANARGNGIFSQSALQSNLSVETRTPTAFGEARTYLQFDFAGCIAEAGFVCNQVNSVATPLLPRLLYAYGTLGGFLAGQANSNFSDNDAGPETIDFGGDVGQAGPVRTPQVRYTYPGPWGMALSASLETPETDAITPAGKTASDATTPGVFGFLSTANANTTGCVANGRTQGGVFDPTFSSTSVCSLPTNPFVSKAPDFTLSDYWAQPWGHVDFRFVGRELSINDGHFVSRNTFGVGGGISGTIIPNWFGWAKDNFVAQFNIGNGIGRYINDFDSVGVETNYQSVIPDCATPRPGCNFAASNIVFRTVPEQGASAGYQHWWLPNLRSNFTFGWQHYGISGAVIGPLASVNTNKQIWSTHVNLIWSPVGFIDTGIEWLWSQRETLAGLLGTQNALIASFAVKF
jgi:hypothetical protein